MLTRLAPKLQGTDRALALKEAFAAVLSMDPGHPYQGQALRKIVPQLEVELAEKALELSISYSDEWFGPKNRVELFCALASVLRGENRNLAISRAIANLPEIDQLRMQDPFFSLFKDSRQKTVLPICEVLDRGARLRLLSDELAMVGAIQWTDVRATALAELVPGLEDELVPAAFAIGRTIEVENDRARALAALAPCIRPEHCAEMMRELRRLQEDCPKAQLLSALAPRLPTELLNESTEIALGIGLSSARALALTAVAAEVAEPILGQVAALALAAALEITEADSQLNALIALMPWLQADARSKTSSRARAVAQKMETGKRLRAQMELSRHLTGEAQEQVLDDLLDTLECHPEGDQIWALIALAPLLKGRSATRGSAMARSLVSRDCHPLIAFIVDTSAPNPIKAEVRSAVADQLWRDLAGKKREDVLKFIADQKLFAPPVFDPECLAAIAHHIVEICQDWEWL